MTTQYVNLEVRNGIARVTLNRPDLHNAFNEVVMQQLSQAFQSMGSRVDVRCIVLQSEGTSFCAGADVHWMKRMVDYSFDENVADAQILANMLRTIRECPKPVIARVHGAAIGGGVGLTAACDLAGAVESAVFCLSEVKLGIIPAVISPFVLEKIGMSAMRRYALTAERFGAIEAKRIGLVQEVFPDIGTMDHWIEDCCAEVKAAGPEAISACKATLREVSAVDWDRLQGITTRRIAERRVSAEGQEGLKSFLDKRPARWNSSR